MFYSILFPTREKHEQPRQNEEPKYFKDLNLDLILAPVLMEDKGFGRKELKKTGYESVFYTPLRDKETIKYRQNILRELEDDKLRSVITGFVQAIDDIEGIVSSVHDSIESTIKWRDNYLVRGQLLECTEKYSKEVAALSEALSGFELRSEGLRAFSEYLKTYLSSKEFNEMCEHAARLREGFSKVEYCMHIKIPTIRIKRYEGQPDQAKDLLAVFSKFNQGIDVERRGNPDESQDFRMEATVLNLVALSYKEVFANLDVFCEKYYNFEDKIIMLFFREINFYLSWLNLIAPLRQNGLKFCYPQICTDTEHIYSYEGFDMALACLRGNGETIVTNDFEMRSPERIIVVTGPNQGGKTTFARAFGQAHHLALLGLCVPGREASLYMFENILTHFEREENLTTLNGMLQDDLIRLRDLLDEATSRSIVIINEIFGSTTLRDALVLGKRMMNALSRLDAPAMVVTFLDELATCGEKTVSMMSTVKEDDPTERLFKIVRKPADGLAYAMHLARKNRLTYEQVVGRIVK